MTSSPAPAPSRQHGIFFALIPWLGFSVLANHGASPKLAAVVALLAAIGVALPNVVTGRPKILELGAIVGFAGITAYVFSVDPATAETFTHYARGVAAALLALIAFGSLLFTPFTEQYARESVPESAWNSPTFKAVNRQLTVMWGCVFAAMVPLHIIAGELDTHQANVIFNWALPIALIVWAVKRSNAPSAPTAPAAAAR